MEKASREMEWPKDTQSFGWRNRRNELEGWFSDTQGQEDKGIQMRIRGSSSGK